MFSGQSFYLIISTLFLGLLFPVASSAQYRDLDVAMSNLERGFGSGDPQALVAGMGSGDKVQLQFPGLIDQSGFFGRDQAAYLLDSLFNKVRPTAFKRVSAKRMAAEGQYQIIAKWTINSGTTVNLYITLKQKDTKWSLVSARSAR
jgi:hypothetical protein